MSCRPVGPKFTKDLDLHKECTGNHDIPTLDMEPYASRRPTTLSSSVCTRFHAKQRLPGPRQRAGRVQRRRTPRASSGLRQGPRNFRPGDDWRPRVLTIYLSPGAGGVTKTLGAPFWWLRMTSLSMAFVSTGAAVAARGPRTAKGASRAQAPKPTTP